LAERIGPPGIAGVGVMVTPATLANGPVGVGMVTWKLLNVLMLKSSSTSQKAEEILHCWC